MAAIDIVPAFDFCAHQTAWFCLAIVLAHTPLLPRHLLKPLSKSGRQPISANVRMCAHTHRIEITETRLKWTIGVCFGSNYTILKLDIPDNPSKPCLSCTKQWCLNQNLPICAGATLGDTNPDTATGKEGDVEARCFRACLCSLVLVLPYPVPLTLRMSFRARFAQRPIGRDSVSPNSVRPLARRWGEDPYGEGRYRHQYSLAHWQTVVGSEFFYSLRIGK
jgi:hypothetical protein